jgi:hypothetical protein
MAEVMSNRPQWLFGWEITRLQLGAELEDQIKAAVVVLSLEISTGSIV